MLLLKFWNITEFVICDGARDFLCVLSHFFIFVCLSFPPARWTLNTTFYLLFFCLHYLHNLKSLGHCFYFCCVYCSSVACSFRYLGIFHNTDNKFNRFSLSLSFFFMPLATELIISCSHKPNAGKYLQSISVGSLLLTEQGLARLQGNDA